VHGVRAADDIGKQVFEFAQACGIWPSSIAALANCVRISSTGSTVLLSVDFLVNDERLIRGVGRTCLAGIEQGVAQVLMRVHSCRASQRLAAAPFIESEATPLRADSIAPIDLTFVQLAPNWSTQRVMSVPRSPSLSAARCRRQNGDRFRVLAEPDERFAVNRESAVVSECRGPAVAPTLDRVVHQRMGVGGLP